MRSIQNHLTAIVLAGGQSSRMGQDKALIPIQGVPLLQLVCTQAIGCADTVYVVTPWQERYRYLLPANCQFIQEVPLTSSENTTLPHGPLVGFAQGLAQVQTEWVLLLACDLPRLRLEVLQEWASGLDLVDDDAVAVLTHHAKGWDPLCGFYRRSCLPKLQEFIARGGRSFQGWLAEHPVQALTLTDSQMLFNCNTPQDLAAVNQLEK
ncbi:MAG: molybdenum cofactor guanylyltransferase [Nostocaceae cyanobacterium]|nr:molybdenum cofactor guanylyltransferase [Nostocaceae cyanobacterium]